MPRFASGLGGLAVLLLVSLAPAEPRWRSDASATAAAASRKVRLASNSEEPSAMATDSAQPLAPEGQADNADRGKGSSFSAPPQNGRASAEPRYARVAESRPPQNGQVWREYDLRPYLDRVKGLDEPTQPLVDWILRETGTERWFGSTAGLLSVEQDKLRVYHLPEVQAIVADVVDRYMHPDLPNYGVSVRLVTVQSVNWRVVAMPWLEPLRVESPGVEAWLLTREHLALLVAHLRERVDVQEHNSASVQILHGQSHSIERYQPRSYPQSVTLTPERFPGYQIQMGQIQEGFSLRISPLLTSDARQVEAVVNCSVDQLEKLSTLTLDLPTRPGATLGNVQVEVPQVASWRLNERFRWPVDRVLLISRGVVAMPGLAGPSNILNKVFVPGAPRADALLFLDCQRLAEGSVSSSALQGARVGRLNYHGRY